MFISEIVSQYNQNLSLYTREYFQNNPTYVETGGRITAIRSQRTLFMTMVWGQNPIQIMCESNNTCNDILRSLHVGDVIEVHGNLIRSMRGELSISPTQVIINSRTQHNIELRQDVVTNNFSLREVNLMRNSELLSNMYSRSHIIQAIRQHMFNQNFIEVETPMLHDNPSGASARTFETHCIANSQNYHLRIAPEIYLVRTLMAGFNQIFEIGHNFRNEGISNRHQPEFTMLECYRSFADNAWAMQYVEQLLHMLGQRFNCEILTRDFVTMTYQNALIQYHPSLGLENSHLIEDREWLISQLPNRDYSLTSLGMLQFQVFETIDNLIIEPTFITNHPIEISPLAQAIEGTEQTERFELFVNGRELGNGFSQLIELEEQRRRFDMQRLNHSDDIMRTDDIYMESMSHGFPRIGGFGIGIDRLVMLLTHQQDIRNVVLYPISS